VSFNRIALFSVVWFLVSCAQRGIPIPASVTGAQHLHAQFAEARARMAEPYILAGEDVERLFFTFRDQLRRLGDERFAAALSKESPDVVAAVAGFTDFRSLDSGYPQTRRVLESAPKIDFPAVKVTDEDRKRE
jgi:hypothetical protein